MLYRVHFWLPNMTTLDHIGSQMSTGPRNDRRGPIEIHLHLKNFRFLNTQAVTLRPNRPTRRAIFWKLALIRTPDPIRPTMRASLRCSVQVRYGQMWSDAGPVRFDAVINHTAVELRLQSQVFWQHYRHGSVFVFYQTLYSFVCAQ